MKLSCVLVACNDNTRYLDFWPIVKEAWWRIAKLPCILVYVGTNIPESLQNDPAVRFFKAIPDWPTATQAQCIRLLYPALLKTNDAVMISDMDILPLQSDCFIDGFEQFNIDQFVSLRGIDEQAKQIYMCYVGATPKTWSDLFNVQTEEDLRNKLVELSSLYPSDGNHGGKGWCTDQLELYKRVKEWEKTNPERVGLVPWTKEIPRLDRGRPQEWIQYSPILESRLKTKHYVDFHMPPYTMFANVIKSIVNISAENS